MASACPRGSRISYFQNKGKLIVHGHPGEPAQDRGDPLGGQRRSRGQVRSQEDEYREAVDKAVDGVLQPAEPAPAAAAPPAGGVQIRETE
jgi:hypothetical protein